MSAEWHIPVAQKPGVYFITAKLRDISANRVVTQLRFILFQWIWCSCRWNPHRKGGYLANTQNNQERWDFSSKCSVGVSWRHHKIKPEKCFCARMVEVYNLQTYQTFQRLKKMWFEQLLQFLCLCDHWMGRYVFLSIHLGRDLGLLAQNNCWALPRWLLSGRILPKRTLIRRQLQKSVSCLTWASPYLQFGSLNICTRQCWTLNPCCFLQK